MISAKKLPEKLHDLTPIQVQYLNDRSHRFIVNPSGRRSRKTLIGKRRLLIRAMENPSHRYFFGAPTRDQAKRIFWDQLKRDTTYFRTAKNESELYVTLMNGTQIWVIGLDKPERIEGIPWDGCHLTEYADLKEDVWPEHIRPVLSDTNGWAQLDGVAEGMNHYYDKALYASGGALPDTEPIKGGYAENPEDTDWCYYHWFSSDVLSEKEIEAARSELDERTFKQEYEGAFVSYAGLAYYAFSNENIKHNKQDINREIAIGMDFNVDPMTATFNHIVGKDIYQFGEAYLHNSNTYEMSEHIKGLFGNRGISIYPDSTGRARESNATESDLNILRKEFNVMARSVNPRQRDRVNAVNSKLSSGGVPHYFIDPSCKETINGFNRATTLPDGRLNKKLEGTGVLDITAAAGYLISYLFPIRGKNLEVLAR